MKSKLLVVLGGLVSVLGVGAQSPTFTYQGQLSVSGNPGAGLFDMRFTLHNAANAGLQVGNALTNATVGVTNGLFTVELNFGSSVFDGNPRWLEIGVRPNGNTGAYTPLNPRQLITATPYALRAALFDGAVASTNLTGKISDTNLSANVALLTNNVIFTRSVTASNFIGNGLGLTNLSATNLIGILPDARLSTNVAFVNTSNTTFKGSVTATNFYGEGRGLTNVPGRIFDFVPSSSLVNPAYANYGYLATSDTTPVVVTLPANNDIPIGNIVRVSGSGAAGWIIVQNDGQTILLGNLLNNVGVSWTTNGPTAPSWKAIAASADGRKLVAAPTSGLIHTSTNYGATWSSQALSGSRLWTSVTSSADGTKLAACVNNGLIYTSTDSGVNWVQRTTFGNRGWTGIASSLDGNRLVACANGTGVYISTDSGLTWPASPNLSGAVSWSGVASSGNGSNLVAGIQGNFIYTSSNAGASWTNRESSRSWTCVASSLDGSVLVAGVNAGANFLYVSSDFGINWVPNTIAANWAGVACSADGSRIIAVANGGGVYISENTGVNWQLRGNLPFSATYTGAASSSDGSTLAATANANGIFVSSKATTTVGTAGRLIGSRLAAIELQYIGNGVFIPISHVGTILAK